MLDIRKRFVKCNGRYHLLTLEDVKYAKKHNKWPAAYEEVELENEGSNFMTISAFTGKKPSHDEAIQFAKLASQLGVPIIKKEIAGQTINSYPKYWLEEMFSYKNND
jgi:hypothetical protein